MTDRIPSPPRYEARKRDGIPERPSWGIYDTFVASWVEFQAFVNPSAATAEAGRLNIAYGEWIR